MIGGEYYFDVTKPATHSLKNQLDNLFQNIALYATGRDALFTLFANSKTQKIWLPSYLCRSVMSAAQQAVKNIGMYDINEDLSAAQDWTDEIKPGDLVVLIHYFGVPEFGLLEKVHQRGGVAVSDVTHMLFNTEALQEVVCASDYSIGSLRKAGPFPDGAFCGSSNNSVPNSSDLLRKNFWVPRAAAMFSRGFSANNTFVNDENFDLFREAESDLDNSPAGPYGMSFVSKGIMTAINMKSQRCAIDNNSAILASCLLGKCILPTLNRGISQYFVCDFGSKGLRDYVRSALAKKRIYCAIHWDTSFLKKSHFLSDQLLSIPCDSRYSVLHMQNISDELYSIL